MNRTITYNPDTHVLVPKEPAESMVHAAEDLPPPRMFGAVYRAMLAAAPEPVQAVGQKDGYLAPIKLTASESSPGLWTDEHGTYYEPATPPIVQQGALSLDDLQAIDRAMQHMGDQVNNMDAVEEGDFEIVNPGFEAIKRALAVTTSPAVDAESVRDAALEEAAKLAETVRIQTYAVSSYATQVLCARETIAEAIRALKSDKGASND